MAINGTVVVTGASGGIGRALVELLRCDGVQVAELAFSRWASHYGPVDVVNPSAVDGAFVEIERKQRPIRMLVNCAAVNANGPVIGTAPSTWRSIVGVNLEGTVNCCRAAASYMTAGGTIINLSSIVARTGLENGAAYAASKGAVESFTKSFAKEVGPRDITVNALALGYFDCGLIRDVPEKTRESIIKRTPVRRLGRAEEVAAMCLYLDTARFVTGAVIPMDGGL